MVGRHAPDIVASKPGGNPARAAVRPFGGLAEAAGLGDIGERKEVPKVYVPALHFDQEN